MTSPSRNLPALVQPKPAPVKRRAKPRPVCTLVVLSPRKRGALDAYAQMGATLRCVWDGQLTITVLAEEER